MNFEDETNYSIELHNSLIRSRRRIDSHVKKNVHVNVKLHRMFTLCSLAAYRCILNYLHVSKKSTREFKV